MGDYERNSTVQRTHEWTSSANGAFDNPPSSSSFLDDLRRDEPRREETDSLAADDASVITYSYYSTVSTNYTMSNLEGTGRIIGNLYSKAGAALERRLGRIANRAAIKAAAEASEKALKAEEEAREEARRVEAEALNLLRYRVFLGDDLSENEKVCDALLICAKYVFLSFVRALLTHDVTVHEDRTTSPSRPKLLGKSYWVSSGSRQKLARPSRISSRDAVVTALSSRGGVQASNTACCGCIGTG